MRSWRPVAHRHRAESSRTDGRKCGDADDRHRSVSLRRRDHDPVTEGSVDGAQGRGAQHDLVGRERSTSAGHREVHGARLRVDPERGDSGVPAMVTGPVVNAADSSTAGASSTVCTGVVRNRPERVDDGKVPVPTVCHWGVLHVVECRREPSAPANNAIPSAALAATIRGDPAAAHRRLEGEPERSADRWTGSGVSDDPHRLAEAERRRLTDGHIVPSSGQSAHPTRAGSATATRR